MSKLPGFSRRSDKAATSLLPLLGAGIFAVIASLAIACGGGDGGSKDNSTEDGTPTPVASATATTPEAQAPLNRLDCQAILAAPPYQSPEEAQWYKDN